MNKAIKVGTRQRSFTITSTCLYRNQRSLQLKSFRYYTVISK